MIDFMHIRQLLRRMDWALFCTVCVLMVLGVLFIYSATWRGEGVPMSPFYKKQIVWALIGLALFFLITLADYHVLGENAWWLYSTALVLLVLVLFVGREVYGAHRWLSFFGVQVQPSELAKIAVIVTLAQYLSRPNRDMGSPQTTALALLIMGIPLVLILQEPDLGTSAVLLPITVLMLYAVGVPLKFLVFLGVLGLLFLPLGWFGLDDYQKKRIMVFLDPSTDPLGAGWNKMQSEIAVGSGGLLGKGWLHGTQNVLGFLPRTVAPNDFIYSVIAEETGFVGSVVILLLFVFVFFGCFRAALAARDAFGRLLCVGVAVMLYVHVMVNIAMTVGLMPITGLPLPLMSYGGSFMVSIMIALGIVQSVYVRRYRG